MSAERDRLIAASLIEITDRCSEALAASELKDCSLDDVHDLIAGINRLIWDLRWEIGPASGNKGIGAELIGDHHA